MVDQVDAAQWTNWAGNVSSRPEGWAFPSTVDELSDLIRSCYARGGRVKVVGSGHSFSPIAASDGALAIALHQLDAGVSVDRASRQITAPAGMLLKDFVKAAAQNGLALKHLGAVVEQTVAGAIATGTHGSGLGFGGLAELTTGFEFVSGTGEVLTATRSDSADRWAALAVGLGGLGVLTRVTFACEDAFNLRLEQTPSRLGETLERLDEYNASRNFGFWWFPGSDRVLLRHFNVTDRSPDVVSGLRTWLHNVLMRNWLHQALLLGSSAGVLPVEGVNACMFRAAFGTPSVRVGPSADIVTSKIRIAQHVMEFSLPYDAARPAVERLRRLIEQGSFPTHSPVDVRFSGPDEAWLGLSHGRRSCFIGIVVYQPFGRHVASKDYFRAVDRMLRDFDSRPHWGKIHYRDRADLAPRYACWHSFEEARDELDPKRIFSNSYLERVLGP